MLRKLTAVVVLMALALSVAPLSAQDGLSEEEQALLQAYIDGVDAVFAYGSYVENRTEAQYQHIAIQSGGATVQEQETSKTQDTTTTIVRGDNPGGMKQIVISTDDGTTVTVVNVELRHVDGVLYASGSYTEGIGDMVFPSGFVEVDPEAADVFAEYDVDDFTRTVMGEPDEENPLRNLETLTSVVETVTSGEGDLNGETVNTITMTIPTSRLFDLLQQTDPETFGDPQLAALFGFVSDEGGAEVDLYLDDDGNALASHVIMEINIVDFDVTQLDPTAPEGFTLSMSITLEETAILSQINEDLPAITAP